MRYQTDRAAVAAALTLFSCMVVAGCAPHESTEPGRAAAPADHTAPQVAMPDQSDAASAEDFDAIMVVRTEPKRIAPGETIELLIQVDRRADIGDVHLRLQDLPPGVVMVGEQVLLRPDERVHRIMLQATPRAQGVIDAPVTIVATADGQPDVAHVFRLTVAGPSLSGL